MRPDKKLLWCPQGFLKDRDLASVINGMLNNPVKEIVKGILASRNCLSEPLVAEALNCGSKFFSSAQRVVDGLLPCCRPGIFYFRPVLFRRHALDERRHRYAFHAAVCVPDPHTNMQGQFPNGMRCRQRAGDCLLVVHIGKKFAQRSTVPRFSCKCATELFCNPSAFCVGCDGSSHGFSDEEIADLDAGKSLPLCGESAPVCEVGTSPEIRKPCSPSKQGSKIMLVF